MVISHPFHFTHLLPFGDNICFNPLFLFNIFLAILQVHKEIEHQENVQVVLSVISGRETTYRHYIDVLHID